MLHVNPLLTPDPLGDAAALIKGQVFGRRPVPSPLVPVTFGGAMPAGITRDFTDAATGDVLHVVNGDIIGYTAGSLSCQQLDYNVAMNTTSCVITADTKYIRGVFTPSDTPC